MALTIKEDIVNNNYNNNENEINENEIDVLIATELLIMDLEDYDILNKLDPIENDIFLHTFHLYELLNLYSLVEMSLNIAKDDNNEIEIKRHNTLINKLYPFYRKHHEQLEEYELKNTPKLKAQRLLDAWNMDWTI